MQCNLQCNISQQYFIWKIDAALEQVTALRLFAVPIQGQAVFRLDKLTIPAWEAQTDRVA